MEMIRLDIPGRGIIELLHAAFDVNGTLAVDGKPIAGVVDRLQMLAEHLSLHVLTAGTHGNIPELERSFGFPFHKIETGQDKMHYVEHLVSAGVIAFGNGRNDASMLRAATIGVAILAAEGVAIEALHAADVLSLGPIDAIELLLKPKRLIATLRE